MDRNTEMEAQRLVKRARMVSLGSSPQALVSGPQASPLGCGCSLAKPNQEFS